MEQPVVLVGAASLDDLPPQPLPLPLALQPRHVRLELGKLRHLVDVMLSHAVEEKAAWNKIEKYSKV